MIRVRFVIPRGQFKIKDFAYIPIYSNIQFTGDGNMQTVTLDIFEASMETLQHDLRQRFKHLGMNYIPLVSKVEDFY